MLSSAGTRSSSTSCSLSSTSWCSVPIASAMRRAATPSLRAPSSNASVNVCTGPRAARFARFVMEDESIPEERKTASGTSLIRCSLIQSTSISENCSSFRSSRGAAGEMSQKRSRRCARPPPSNTLNSPGRTASTPLIAVFGPGTNPFHATEAAAAGSSRGFTSSPDASSARTSEANASAQLPSASGLRARYTGLIPNGSRARRSVRATGSQLANANMPRNSRTASAPLRASIRSMTWVSPVESKRSPPARSRSRSSWKL